MFDEVIAKIDTTV